MPTKGRVSSGGEIIETTNKQDGTTLIEVFRDLSPGEKNPQAPPKGGSWFVWTVTWTPMFTAKAARLPWRVNFLEKTSDLSAKWTIDILLCSASNSISGVLLSSSYYYSPGCTIIPGIHGGVGWVSLRLGVCFGYQYHTTITEAISPPCYGA